MSTDRIRLSRGLGPWKSSSNGKRPDHPSALIRTGAAKGVTSRSCLREPLQHQGALLVKGQAQLSLGQGRSLHAHCSAVRLQFWRVSMRELCFCSAKSCRGTSIRKPMATTPARRPETTSQGPFRRGRRPVSVITLQKRSCQLGLSRRGGSRAAKKTNGRARQIARG